MKKYAIVTDSAAGLEQSFIDEHDIKVLPMSVIVEGIAYKEGLDKSVAEIYELLKESGEGAKTSQPTIGEFMEIFNEIEENDEYDSIISIHASSELTGTYQSALSVSEEIEKPVTVIDSKFGSYPMGQMVARAVEGRRNGESLEEVEAEINEIIRNSQLYLLPHSFSQLKKSGRVSASQSMLASLLKVQLQLKFEDGKVVVGHKVRTKKKMGSHMLEVLEGHMKKDGLETLAVVYAGDRSLADEWEKAVREALPDLKLVFEPLVTVAGVHVGHGTIAFGLIKGR
ncbi:DegV family protein [Salinicoccus kekensis]|uniref:DegV family protein with EDD domain n=1 Tax=Salinicoccus kekensis TaxID=714307 RepID=A0A285URQ1_9STAP|nr:DegV family protein [Salinicoccus kekensis]SOC44453.1 DegV family protein with EDD domain [Salinicoccus kekensis]